MQQSTASWCLFDTNTREVGSTNITLGHSVLEVTSKRFGEEKTLLNY